MQIGASSISKESVDPKCPNSSVYELHCEVYGKLVKSVTIVTTTVNKQVITDNLDLIK